MKKCSGLYEQLATRELPSRVVYANLLHGVFAVLDVMPAAEGHIAVASLVCRPSVDEIESSVLRNKMTTVATYAGRVLALAYREAPYIAEITAGNQIPHPHIHRLPGDPDANCFKRFSKLEDWPRLKFSADRMDDTQGRLCTPAPIQELWQACDAEVAALGAPDADTIAAITELGLILPN